MTTSAFALPEPLPNDPEVVITALETAEIFGVQGDVREAVRWVRRAAELAGDAGIDDRALALARAAADLTANMSSRPAPPPPPPPPTAQPPAAFQTTARMDSGPPPPPPPPPLPMGPNAGLGGTAVMGTPFFAPPPAPPPLAAAPPPPPPPPAPPKQPSRPPSGQAVSVSPIVSLAATGEDAELTSQRPANAHAEQPVAQRPSSPPQQAMPAAWEPPPPAPVAPPPPWAAPAQAQASRAAAAAPARDDPFAGFMGASGSAVQPRALADEDAKADLAQTLPLRSRSPVAAPSTQPTAQRNGGLPFLRPGRLSAELAKPTLSFEAAPPEPSFLEDAPPPPIQDRAERAAGQRAQRTEPLLERGRSTSVDDSRTLIEASVGENWAPDTMAAPAASDEIFTRETAVLPAVRFDEDPATDPRPEHTSANAENTPEDPQDPEPETDARASSAGSEQQALGAEAAANPTPDAGALPLRQAFRACIELSQEEGVYILRAIPNGEAVPYGMYEAMVVLIDPEHDLFAQT